MDSMHNLDGVRIKEININLKEALRGNAPLSLRFGLIKSINKFPFLASHIFDRNFNESNQNATMPPEDVAFFYMLYTAKGLPESVKKRMEKYMASSNDPIVKAIPMPLFYNAIMRTCLSEANAEEEKLKRARVVRSYNILKRADNFQP